MKVALWNSGAPQEAPEIKLYWHTGIVFVRHVYFLGWTSLSGPHPPNPVRPPKQRGYQSARFSNRHPSAYSLGPETEVLQSCRAKTEIGTPMHTLPTRHPKLACTATNCSHFFRFLLIILFWRFPGCCKIFRQFVGYDFFDSKHEATMRITRGEARQGQQTVLKFGLITRVLVSKASEQPSNVVCDVFVWSET